MVKLENLVSGCSSNFSVNKKDENIFEISIMGSSFVVTYEQLLDLYGIIDIEIIKKCPLCGTMKCHSSKIRFTHTS